MKKIILLGTYLCIFSLAKNSPLPEKRFDETTNLKSKLLTRWRCQKVPNFLILVSSAINHFEHRTLIRKTWGHDYSGSERWKTVFVITKGNPDQEVLMEREIRKYRDIIRGNHEESYYKMGHKVSVGFEWMSKFCDTEFVMKVDDDIFVNPMMALQYITHIEQKQRKSIYTGNLQTKAKVERRGKHRLSIKEWPFSFYTPFCSGGAFLISTNILSKILDIYDFESPLSVDDAYIGHLVHQAGFRGTMNHDFRMFAYTCSYGHEIIAQHPANAGCMLHLFRQLQNDPQPYNITITRK